MVARTLKNKRKGKNKTRRGGGDKTVNNLITSIRGLPNNSSDLPLVLKFKENSKSFP